MITLGAKTAGFNLSSVLRPLSSDCWHEAENQVPEASCQQPAARSLVLFTGLNSNGLPNFNNTIVKYDASTAPCPKGPAAAAAVRVILESILWHIKYAGPLRV